MAKASVLSKELQGIVDRIGTSNITRETRQQVSDFSEKFQSYVDTHNGNFSDTSQSLQSVKDQVADGSLTKELRTSLQGTQRDLQSQIDKSK